MAVQVHVSRTSKKGTVLVYSFLSIPGMAVIELAVDASGRAYFGDLVSGKRLKSGHHYVISVVEKEAPIGTQDNG